jgi:hypothetical protein
MPPNNLSATILDNLVKSLDILGKGLNFSKSIKEHSLGADIETRDLEVGYGLSSIVSNDFDYLLSIAVLGKGYVKSVLGGYNVAFNNNNQTGITLADIINNSDIYNNCYFIGAINLSLDVSNNPVLSTNLFTPSNDPLSTDPFIIYKDISLDEVTNIVNFSTDFISDSGYDVSIELYKFILDVDFYDGTTQSARAGLYLIDNRQVSGVLTYAEETLAFSFMNALNQNYSLTQRIYDKTKSNIKTIVNSWMTLSSWEPSFVDYWNLPGNTLPTNLKNFLENELGIIV